MPVELQAIGNVEAISTVSIKAQISGQLMRVHFKEGDFVKKGQLLFTIDRQPFEAALRQAEGTLAKDEAQALNSKLDAERYQGLGKQGMVSKQQVDAAGAAANAMAATVAADKAAVETAKINLEYTSIYSPINGRTGSVGVKEGNLVKANDVPILVTINQIEPIYVSFSIPEQQLAELKQYSNTKSLKVDAAPQGSTQHFQGRLTFIDNSVDLTTGTIKLKATFDNAAHVLWPGQFADVNLTLKSQPNADCGPDGRAADQPERHVRLCGRARPHGQAAAGKSRLERGRGHGDCFRIATGAARCDRRPVAPDARR